MKDKRAARRKRKRRAEVIREERENAASLYAQYEAERRRLGMPKVRVKPKELMRIYKKTERDATVQAIMYGVIAAMTHMHEYYRWSNKRLHRAAGALTSELTE